MKAMANHLMGQLKEIVRTSKGDDMSDLMAKFKEGVLLDDNKYFWLDGKNRLGVELYPRALSITWGSSPQYWTYTNANTRNGKLEMETARLNGVCWFHVSWEFDMRKLTIGVEYEILLDMELASSARGWTEPVTFEHKRFSGLKRKLKMRVDHLVGKGRTQISMGKFKLPCLPVGTPNATFHVYEHSDYSWKSGIIIFSVSIKPIGTTN